MSPPLPVTLLGTRWPFPIGLCVITRVCEQPQTRSRSARRLWEGLGAGLWVGLGFGPWVDVGSRLGRDWIRSGF